MAVLFHRDFRLQDHKALSVASKNHDNLYLLFFLNPEQIKGDYAGAHSLQFMMESLESLPIQVIEANWKKGVEILNDLNIPVYYNVDYSHYAKDREKYYSQNLKVPFTGIEGDFTLASLDVRTKNKKFFRKFTPFYRAVKDNLDVRNYTVKPFNILRLNLPEVSLKIDKRFDSFPANREAALQRLENAKTLDYNQNSLTETTRLSPYLKFGLLSIREVARAITNEELIRQLLWHDYFAYRMRNLPVEDTLGVTYSSWENDPKKIEQWKSGNTGFILIDAAMRQLKKEGFMANRLRLLCANYLVLTLKVDWKIGEQHFAKYLVDYDVSSNNGNWRYVCGLSGNLARVYNPERHLKLYDPERKYVSAWVDKN